MPTEASSETATEESLGGSAAREIIRLSPGQMLRAARVQQNLTQREVAETLHITMHYVNAIEHDDHDKLPGAVFAKGYIKRYAEIMALDETAVMASYEGLSQARPAAIGGTSTNTEKARRFGKSLWMMAASATVFITLFLGLWAWNGEEADTPRSSVIPVLSELPGSTSPEQLVTPMPAALAGIGSASRRAATAVKGEGKDTLKLSFSGTSWIEVRDSGSGDRYRDLRVAGDVLEIKGLAPFDVFLGDASRIRLFLNGVDIDLSQETRIDNSVQLTVGL